MPRTNTMQGFTPAAITAVENHFNSTLNIKFGQNQWSVKCRSRVQGHCVCLKRTYSSSTHGFTLAAITSVEKHTLLLDSS